MRRRFQAAFAIGLLFTVRVVPAKAYDPITWYTFDGGGVTGVVAGTYKFGGTMGQPDPGTLTGGNFKLSGGFWIGGTTQVTGIVPHEPPKIAFRFSRATPNPVRARSQIAFDLPAETQAQLSIYDVAGRVVRIEDWGTLPAGHHERTWNAVDGTGRRLSSGVYFLRFAAGNERGVQRVLVIR